MLICAMPYRHGVDTGAVSVLSLITVGQNGPNHPNKFLNDFTLNLENQY
jgi:hypothetical protein